MPESLSRRRFLKLGAAGFFAAPFMLSLSSCRRRYDFEMILSGGMLCDGSGEALRSADIGIRNGRIAAIGKLAGRSAGRIVDVGGLTVAPGFIDFHSHSDDELLLGGTPQSKIRQGVTTEVLGQDGESMAPLTPEMRDDLDRRLRDRYDIGCTWMDFAGYFQALTRRGMICNALSMVGQGTLREYVIGESDRPADQADIARMRALARDAFARGACGISSGLEYTPGSFADTAELVELCRAMDGKGIYATHMRNEDDTVLEAVQEAITIARESGVRLNISHMKSSGRRNWEKLPAIFRLLDAARADGMTATCDRYPYVAYNTGLSSLFPLWSREGGREKFVERLQETALADSIRSAVMRKIEKIGGWVSVMVSNLPHHPGRRELEGKRLSELAAAGDPYDILLKMVLVEEGGGDMVGFAMSEENTARILAYPYCMIASDASALAVEGRLRRGNPHPRSYGSFPRVLGKYVREETLISLPEAVRKMSALPAEMLGLADRGRLREDYAADIVVFDPETVIDRATWSEPHQYPAGIRHVLVNGEIVIEDGDHTGKRAGRVLTV